MTYLLGIDVGTTHTKAVVYAPEAGEIVGSGHCRTITHHPRPGWSEFQPDEVWDGVVRSVREALAQCPDRADVAAVAVASMGEAGVLLDQHGAPLYPIIAWYDPRTEQQSRHWRESFGAESIFAITGQLVEPKHSVNKLLWLREHEPVCFGAARHWLCVHDFIVRQLSGELATDYSIASRTMLFDQARRQWSAPLLAHAGLPAEWFPPAYPSGSPVGRVRRDAAARTGIPESALVVTGGHDHLCGALAAGVVGPGVLLASLGTAAALLTLSDQFQPASGLRAQGFATYANVLPGTYVIVGGLNAAGGALEWLVDQLYGVGGAERYAAALRDAMEAPLGADGLFILPHFRGSGTPDRDDRTGAAFVGLTPAHDRRHLVRALLEGLGYWLRDNVEALRRVGVAPDVTELVAIGSITRSPAWLQLTADVTGRTVRGSHLEEATATGAALLAGMGAGVFQSAGEAAASLKRREVTVEPEPTARQRYDRRYQRVYTHLYPALAELQHVSRAIADDEEGAG